MDRAWEEFNASLSRTWESKNFTTRFRYPVKEDSTDAVESGLEKLRRCAPFVIVFNPEFSMIEAQSADASEVVAGIVDALADQRVRLTVLAHE